MEKTVHEKYNEMKERIKEKGAVDDEPIVAGNFVSSSIKKNNMGCMVEETVYDNEYTETVVTAPALDYVHDYS